MLGLSLPESEVFNTNDFQLRVPPGFSSRIQRNSPNDPLLLQVLPRKEEENDSLFSAIDPLGESIFTKTAGLIQKYQGRALVQITDNCAIHCRYCFRRHSQTRHALSSEDWQQICEEISKDQSISEIILSGGDPLTLGNKRLAQIIKDIDRIPQIRRLRIHTRIPIVLPERIDASFLSTLQASSKLVVLVVHCNHSNEIDSSVESACKELINSGVRLLNQSVLLASINDSPEVLCQLSDDLFGVGIQPYYLHLPDKVLGTGHFNVTEDRALKIYEKMLARLPGYLLPKLVKEIPGRQSKSPIY